MPYARAHYYVLFVLVITVIGFWPSYFMKIGSVPLAFHVHALTAITWVLLVLCQCWSIHSGRRDLHRTVGKLSLILFPFLIVGFVMIVNVSAARFAANSSASAMYLTPSFGWSMMVAIAAYLIVYYRALKHRRNVFLHAGYMLTTPLILFESAFSRIILDHLPFLVFTGSEGSQRVLDAIVISMVMSVVFALVVYSRDRKRREPFLVAAVLLTVESFTMAFGGSVQVMRDLFAAYSTVPPTVTIALGFLLGTLVAWRGWKSTPEKLSRPVAES